MKQEVSLSMFRDDFQSCRPNDFSYDGLEALYNYLEEFEDLEFDVIGLCCEYCEFEDVEQYLKSYDTDVDKSDYTDEDSKEFDEEDFNQAVMQEIQNKTSFIDVEGDGFIICSYWGVKYGRFRYN